MVSATARGKPSRSDLYEMNIRVGSGLDSVPTEMPLKLLENPVIIRQMQEAAISAILDVYTVVVYNFFRDGNTPLTLLDKCEFKGFDNLE